MYALPGQLVLARHLTENLVHKERFYVRDQVYNFDSPLNRILGQALRLATSAALRNRLGELSLRFPELPDQQPVTEETFLRLRYDRRTEAYRPAIQIARLLLLNYHPDLQSGRRHVLALLFNMNQLWEGFLLHSLRRHLPDYKVSGRTRANYWKAEGLRPAPLKPDIAIYRDGQLVAILDAKWKRPQHQRPSAGDLQQLFTYAGHFGADRVALVYPSVHAARSQAVPERGRRVQGRFVKSGAKADLLWLPVGEGTVKEWMSKVAKEVKEWL